MDDGQSLVSKSKSLESGGVPGDRPVTYLGEKFMQGEFAERGSIWGKSESLLYGRDIRGCRTPPAGAVNRCY